jgi:hypothetical protein
MTHRKIEMNNQPDTTDGEVGYKHPPVKSQFRKGQSGNPRGRRKGQRNLTPVLLEVLRQTVKVKRGGKAQLMSKSEALIHMLLNKAHNGERKAINAMLYLTEKIVRIDAPEPQVGGVGGYEFMLIPGVANSAEEWQREINMRHEMAEIREIIAAGRAAGKSLNAVQRATLREAVDAARAAGTTMVASQLDALRETLGLARASEAPPTVTRRPVTRRPVHRRDTRAPAPNKLGQQANSETAALPQAAAVQPTLPCVSVARTPTYRKVNRRQPRSTNDGR